MIGGELYATGISLQIDHLFLFPIKLVCDQLCRVLGDEYCAIGQLVKFGIDHFSFKRDHGVRVFKRTDHNLNRDQQPGIIRVICLQDDLTFMRSRR